MENKSWSFKQIILLALEVIIIYLIIFTKWLGFSIFYGEYISSLPRVFNLLKHLADSGIESSLIDFFIFLVYVLLVLGVIAICFTFNSIIKAAKTHERFSKAGFIYAIVLPGLLLIFVLIINAVIDSKTNGYIGTLFSLKAPAYCTLALGVVGCLVCERMPDTIFASAGAAASNFVHDTAGRVASFVAENAAAAASDTTAPKPAASASTASTESKAQILKCANCGWSTENKDLRFCANCGSKLITSFSCPNCGKILEPDMKYCPYCASKVGGSAYYDQRPI